MLQRHRARTRASIASTSAACPSSSPERSRASIPLSVGNRTYAVRCFTREVSDQQARYGELSSYLLNVLPPSFVHFEYVERGISFRGDWYPIVRMEWVDGELLSRFVGSRLDQQDSLRRVAAQWRGGPTASLRGLRIAHNDLQHGNVLVQGDGSIRLVDYDGMFLPKFRGERSPELGHKNYQHPARSSEHYDENVDNFPLSGHLPQPAGYCLRSRPMGLARRGQPDTHEERLCRSRGLRSLRSA